MIKNEREFINPYHFIPLPEKKMWYVEDETEQVYTGKLEYVLKTETPLFIPNTSSDHAFKPVEGQVEEHLSYDFFSYKNLEKGRFYDGEWAEPVIPGSEVRGMFRSVYETLTGSCLSGIHGREEKLSKRTMEQYKAGLLKFTEEGLILMKAVNYRYYEGDTRRYPTFYDKCKFQEGAKVNFESEGSRNPKAINVEEWKLNSKKLTGYIIKGNSGPELSKNGFRDYKKEKHNCHIFQEERRWGKVNHIDEARLIDVLNSYKEQSGDEVYAEYRKNIKNFLDKRIEGTCFPVYYSSVGESIYLAPACITRESYINTVQDMIKGFHPCISRTKVCPACKLFGMVGSDTKNVIASKIRFSDLHLVNLDKDLSKCYTKVTTLPPLGQPKVSNTEFYLKHQNGAVFQTFDYYINQNGQLVPYTPEIAGRKFYWHHQITEVPECAERTQLNKTIRAVRPKKEFKGCVYFDKITEKQLKQLVWMLNLSGGKGYKLGTGKPLGLGSITVRLHEEGCCVRTFAWQDEKIVYDMSKKPLGGKYEVGYVETGFLGEVEKEFLFMADLNVTEEKTVSYPYVNPEAGDDNGYEWYTKNHSFVGGKKFINKREDMYTVQHLNGFEEIEGNEYKISNFALSVTPSKRGASCIWIAGYPLHHTQEDKLKELLPKNTTVEKEKTWLKQEDIEKYAKKYDKVALPSNTNSFILQYAKKHFKEVYVAVKNNSKFDNEWKKV